MTRELRTDWYFFNLTLQWFFISYLITYFLLAVTLYQNANYLQLIKCNFEGFFNIYLFNSWWFFYTVVWNKSHSMTSNKTFLNWNPEKSLDIIILTGTKKNWLSSITDLKTRWKQAPVVILCPLVDLHIFLTWGVLVCVCSHGTLEMSDLALPIPLLIRVKHYMAANRSIRRITSVGRKQFSFPNCWFPRDITATMLVIKNKSISLLWELNSIFR